MVMISRFVFLILVLAQAAGAAQRRPLEFADIIEQREPYSPRISPDGRTAAFLVRQSSLKDNASRVGLWVAGEGKPERRRCVIPANW